jgi:hypothetical protein
MEGALEWNRCSARPCQLHETATGCARASVIAHNGPRRIEDRPSASAAVVRGRPKAAHTLDMSETRAVFHAPMFELKADATPNACEPNHAAARLRAPRRRKVLAHCGAVRVRPNPHAHGHPNGRAIAREYVGGTSTYTLA